VREAGPRGNRKSYSYRRTAASSLANHGRRASASSAVSRSASCVRAPTSAARTRSAAAMTTADAEAAYTMAAGIGTYRAPGAA
jgi:hypothetical protein